MYDWTVLDLKFSHNKISSNQKFDKIFFGCENMPGQPSRT